MLDKLNDIDRKILDTLQQDASLTNTELADKVGLSTAPCWRRVKRLEELGIIDRRVAILNPEKLGLHIVTFANVKLSHHKDNALEEFEKLIEVYPEVTECYTISGSMDYVLKIVTTDMNAYENFLRQKLLKMEMVNEVHSRFAVTKVKYTTALPLKISR
ncbi:Lrp/AsnC family transcriptional regulator [Emcibacter sp.]|uniref:Lrp/AsnC family transcriptional regulator n=1 Tax=Emcibacter sp. TaxID=1979954 RepID=UPI002AA8F3D6|nr:Lrp/AsnC family transcriptional regulator [Emcibacter sp.]